jgi:hypothetical protein
MRLALALFLAASAALVAAPARAQAPASAALVAAPARAPAPAEASAVRRVALMVGVNDGGPGRVKLRYATSDAKAFARVLAELGGIERADEIVLVEPSPEALLAGFQRASARVQQARAAGERVQFLFYYSGHADDRGLLIGASRLDYARLRGLIHDVPAHVRLGMLDSCSSGAFVRTKGGRMRPPLATGGGDVEGHAFITSSSAEEAAQESDRIGGSYFTHYLVSGLRGAADIDRDRRVTLNEAYRFAFDETLAGTETTPGRAQHPNYDIQLVGTGDLVLTDLRDTSALLEIGTTVGGRVYVRDARGDLAVELYKGIGAGPVSLALEPGNYSVVVDDGRAIYRANLEVRAGRKNELTGAQLVAITPEPTTARGGLSPLEVEEYRVIPFSIGIVPKVSLNAIEKKRKIVNRGSLDLLYGRAARLEGAAFSLGVSRFTEDVRGGQLGLVGNLAGGEVQGLQWSGAFNHAGTAHGIQLTAGYNYVAGEMYGAQLAAGVNVARVRARGAQIASGVNFASVAHGLQLATINAAGEVQGAQIGVINVARGSVGTQIGVLNVAGDAKASVGLLGVSRKHGVFADVWTSDVAAINLAIKFRARYTYSFVGAGVHPFGAGAAVMFGGGFGGHVPLASKVYLDIDLGTYAAFPKFNFKRDTALLSTLRLLIGVRLSRRAAIFFGPTLNAVIDLAGDRPRPGYGYTVARYPFADYPDISARLWPGFAVGFQL